MAQNPSREIPISRVVGKLDEFFVDFFAGVKTSHGGDALLIDFKTVFNQQSGYGPDPPQRSVEGSFEKMRREPLRGEAMEGTIAFDIRAFSSFQFRHR